MKNQSGFTLIELVLVMAISAILLGFVTFNFIGQQRSVSIQTLADTLISDMYSQQNKAMVGQGSGSSYGIFFETNKYTLFQGDVYSENNPNNFVVNIDPGYSIVNISFTDSIIVFASGSGEIQSYSVNKDSVTVQNDESGVSKKIKLNRYGAIIEED